MRLSTKRLAAPAAVLAALAVAVPAGSTAQPAIGDGAEAAQRSKDPRDRGGRERLDPRCRITVRRVEIAQARVSTAQQKVKRAKQKLKNARVALEEAAGKRAKAKAQAKVTKRKRAVRRARAALKESKAALRDAQQDAAGCGG